MIIVVIHSTSSLMSSLSTARHCFFSAASVSPSVDSRLNISATLYNSRESSDAKVTYYNIIYKGFSVTQYSYIYTRRSLIQFFIFSKLKNYFGAQSPVFFVVWVPLFRNLVKTQLSRNFRVAK